MTKNKPIITTAISRKSYRYPISPSSFANKMTKRIQSLNPDFHCGGKIRTGFLQYAEAYNECVSLNTSGDKQQTVVPAPTGSGKSVSSELYLAEAAKIRLSGLLVVSQISVAIEAAETINGLVGARVAGVYHSISNEHPKHDLWCAIDALPRITIISHALFIQRSDSGKDIEFLRTFEGKQRDIVIVDERIDLIKRVSFGSNEIVEAVGILRRDNRLYTFAQHLDDFNEVVVKAVGNKTGSLQYNHQIKLLHHTFTTEIDSVICKLQKGHYDLTQQLRGIKRNPATDRGHVVDLLRRITYVFESRYSNTVEGSNIVCHREEDLSGRFGSIIVLDATSLINPEYEYRTRNYHNIKHLNRIDSRNYQNVTINVCSSNAAKQSKYAIFNKPSRDNKLDEIVTSYLELIASILCADDQLLVVTYMDIVPLFKEKSPYGNQVEFIYWGSKDARGSNEFSSFNKALVIGWYRKPMHTYVQSIIAINQVDKYVSSHGSIMSDVHHLKDMLIVDDLIQFFNRIRCRTAIDDQGNCNTVELYCLTGGSEEMEQVIRTTIAAEMPNIVFKDWKPKALKGIKLKITKTEERAQIIIKWMRARIEKYEEISFAEIKDYFSFKPYTLSKVINSDAFQDMLDEEGITMTRSSEKSQGNPVRFILPKQKL